MMKRFHTEITRFLLSLFVLQSLGMDLALAAPSSEVLTGDVRVTVSPANIRGTIPITGAQRRVTMSFRGVAVQDALRALARKGGFNVLIDESVEGTVSVDLNNVTIHDALETLKTYGNLAYEHDFVCRSPGGWRQRGRWYWGNRGDG
jgi:hypothetical protein